MITTVIFDLDDTLYDEVDYCKSGFAAAAKELAAMQLVTDDKVAYEVFWKEFSSGNRFNVFNGALKELGISETPDLIERLVTVYRLHRPNLNLPASTKSVLETLSKKYTLALLTDGFLPAQELKVEALGIKHYFKSIIYTEQMGREFWKPSPAGFEKILSELKVKSSECVYVGDNEVKDFIAPNKLGMKTVQLLQAKSIHKQPGEALSRGQDISSATLHNCRYCLKRF